MSKINIAAKLLSISISLASVWLVSGCATIAGWTASTSWQSAAGPSRAQMEELQDIPQKTGIQLVDVNDEVTRKLIENQQKSLFSDTLATPTKPGFFVGAGDVIEISVWEAPPGTLFGGGGSPDPMAGPATSRMTVFPEQMVSSSGTVNIPFAGNVPVAGHTPQQIEAEVVRRLQGKANQPQALVRVTHNNTANVTVIGDVANSLRMPLTSRGERVLDALAAAGGMRTGGGGQNSIGQSINRTALQITRGDQVETMPLEAVIRDPRQNIPLQPGDVVTALFQSMSFTVLGAIGKNDEISFEAQGISLAQALARSGGLQDERSDALGVFIFRLESPKALPWKSPPATTPDGKVAVVYRVNLRDPATFFVAQAFPIQNKDVIYVSNAPGAELQKFLKLVMTAVYPALTLMRSATAF